MKWLLAAWFVVSCAPQPTPSMQSADETREVAALMDAYENELYNSEALAEGADCGRACSLADNICDLAGRICNVAERHPDDAELRRTCGDGKMRCDRAHKHVAQRCTCPVR